MFTMITRRFSSFQLQRIVDGLVQKGQLKSDFSQECAIKALNSLSERLENESDHNFWNIFSNTAKDSARNTGIYLYGSVGSGKTMLMDLFFTNIKMKEKSRWHYHEFMLNFHSKMREIQMDGSDDPLTDMIKHYLKNTKLLCLDEFQVTDIADAMILRKLLEGFFDYGITLVTTSNRHPNELYLNGIQRSSFIPCIELIKSSMQVINLTAKQDYRASNADPSFVKSAGTEKEIFLSPINEENSQKLDAKFVDLCRGSVDFDIKLPVLGRFIRVPFGKLPVAAKFDFSNLFVENKSAVDYLEIVSKFENIFVMRIPELDESMRNEIRRIITFIDEAYEKRVNLYLESSVPIIENLRKIQVSLNRTFDESFSLSRTISRLLEMQTSKWRNDSNSKFQ